MTGRPAYLAIINPAAGGGQSGKRYPDAIATLRDGGLEVEVALTRGPGEATELAQRAFEDGRRHFIAVGGDGTSYEIVNGLFPLTASSDEPPTLGFLPLGTGNSFLRDFTDKGVDDSLPALVEGKTRSIDVIRLEHGEGELHYINLLSIGFVADVNSRRARQFSRWGETGYVASTVLEIAALEPQVFPMAIDEGPIERTPIAFASFNNSKFTGGKMMMAPNADPSDGFIEYVRVGVLSRLSLLRTFPKIFSGRHIEHPAVSQTRVKTVRFAIDRDVDVMVDGEAVVVRPKAMSVLAGALRVHI